MTKILIIDDEPSTQVMLRRILALEEGYDILIASSGKEGIELAYQHQPALIICDWIMPGGMSGLDVCSKIKCNPQLSATFFILLTSAESNEENRVTGLNGGCDDFLSKSLIRKEHELRARVRAGVRVYNLYQALEQEKRHLEAELEDAAEYVSSILPKPLHYQYIDIDSRFIPCRQLGGDIFDYYWLDKDHLAIYLLDVEGHGIKAAFPSVSILNLLRSQSLNQVNFYYPREVLAGLNRSFPMSERHQQSFTIWYGVYNYKNQSLVYASAGHPPAVLISMDDCGNLIEQRLTTRGASIGFFLESEYRQETCVITPQSRLYVFSDGMYEIEYKPGEFWNLEQFIDLLRSHYCYHCNLDDLLQKVLDINHSDDFADDLSIMQLDFR